MPEIEVLSSFLLTALVLELTPGPNMAWLALLAATTGRGAGFAATAGITLGLAVQAVLAAVGVAAAVALWPGLYGALHLAGVGYLLWLAWESWRDAGIPAHHLPGGGESATDGFRRGLVGNLLNPKSLVVFVSLLPGFLRPGDGVTATLALSAVYVLVATLIHAGIAVAAGAARGWVADPAVSVRMHRFQALSLLAVAVWLYVRG
ncbi:MAG: LysE family translocator [Tabrizicola sp.]|nr:LysE family translocator [Tabrizicola sp.]